MLRRLVGWLVLLPLCIVLIVFALANRHTISVHFDPLSSQNPLLGPYDIPLFVLIYAMLLIGVVLGGVASWFAQGAQRQEKRMWRKQAQKLEQENARPARAYAADNEIGFIQDKST